ncbi:MAG: D-aminoacylase [Bryobacterales bacterium]|nr:D-aminoacylase [Bryobacterales bacterium]
MVLFFLWAILTAIPAGAQTFDILIRNARLIDGSGNPWFRADIGIRDGRVAAIGALPDAQAKRTIDAAGRVAAPGFIDVHTHVESTLEKVPTADNYVLDGVTTIVTGNCGGSMANLGEWFTKLEQSGVGLNVSSLIGHNSVRREVMGTANRHATPDELAQMADLVSRNMREGAVGFSTGLIYIPGTYSNTEEVVALAKAAAQHRGVYATHMRDEGERVMDAIAEAVHVGREAGMRVQVSHFKIDNRRLWGMSEKTLARIDQARAEGIDVVVDQYPYERSSTNLGITLPSWALADGNDQLLARLRDPATRARVVREMEALLRSLGHKDYSYATVAYHAPDHSLEGKTIARIAQAKGRRGVRGQIQTILEIMEKGGAQMVYHSMGDEDVERILRYPFTAVASDGGVREFGVGMPHPRSYGTNARVLAEYVRTRNVIRLEDAIRRMTSLPARTFGFRDRGLLRAGFQADIVLFDPGRVQDKATFAEPHQYSEGFDVVLVNGVAVVEDGKVTGARAGRILRHNSGS